MTIEVSPVRARLLGWLRTHIHWIIGLAVAAIAVELFYATGTAAATDDTLQIMGFDPDRAHLLTALIATAMAAAIMALAAAPTALGVLAGLLAGTRGFGHTALTETRAALAAHGTQGTFDPVGWTVSIVTFVVAFAVTGWAAAILAREARSRVVAAARTIRNAVRRHDSARSRARLTAAAGVVLSLVLVAAVLPVFGDMLNYDPDVHMRQNAVGGPGLVDSGAGAWRRRRRGNRVRIHRGRDGRVHQRRHRNRRCAAELSAGARVGAAAVLVDHARSRLGRAPVGVVAPDRPR